MEETGRTQRDDEYRVKLEVFKGPLDLLLHLIRVNKIDICDIPIIQITDQYNAYLDLMKELNFDIAGEFLLMASTLVYIKSKMLLPVEAKEGLGEGMDPRSELTRQLIDYQRYKAASENLTALEDIQSLIWCRSSAESFLFEGEELVEASLFDLVSAFKQILEKREAQERTEIEREDYSVPEKMSAILEILKTNRFLEFSLLFATDAHRLEKITVFLAILELIRLQMIRAFQKSHDDVIRVFRMDQEGGRTIEQN